MSKEPAKESKIRHCPKCGSTNIESHREIWGSQHYVCRDCAFAFELRVAACRTTHKG